MVLSLTWPCEDWYAGKEVAFLTETRVSLGWDLSVGFCGEGVLPSFSPISSFHLCSPSCYPQNMPSMSLATRAERCAVIEPILCEWIYRFFLKKLFFWSMTVYQTPWWKSICLYMSLFISPVISIEQISRSGVAGSKSLHLFLTFDTSHQIMLQKMCTKLQSY